MSSLKELRKLAAHGPGWYAVMPDGSVKAANLFDETTMTGSKNLYYQHPDGKWQGWDGDKWNDLTGAPESVTKPTIVKAQPTATKIKHSPGAMLEDANYTYSVLTPLSFSYVSKTDPTNKGHFDSTKKTWETAVKTLNSMKAGIKPEIQSAQTTTAPDTEPEAAKPAAPETATPAATLDAGLVQKVEFILGRAMNYSLNVKSGHSEKAQISKLVSAVESTKKSGSGLNFLAQMIVASAPNAFQAIAAADLATLGKATMKDLAVHRNGAYSGDVGVILGKINEIAANYAKDPKTITGIKTQPTKSANKYPAKIIRLASLRRLRVRSEMEAAITSSAMPGRDRVG